LTKLAELNREHNSANFVNNMNKKIEILIYLKYLITKIHIIYIFINKLTQIRHKMNTTQFIELCEKIEELVLKFNNDLNFISMLRMRDEIGGLMKKLKSQKTFVNSLSYDEQQRINNISNKIIKIEEMTSSKNSNICNKSTPRQNLSENNGCNYFSGCDYIHYGSSESYGNSGSGGGSYQNSCQENLNCSL